MTLFSIKQLSRKLTAGLALILIATSQAFAVTVEDSFGKHEFSQPATRVITLNWGATEEVLELGVTPVGIADIQGY
ncbi:iron-siderophore ABC transporter substrate-binding protein, partial [Oceanospirillum sp. HFRX-1_2]